METATEAGRIRHTHSARLPLFALRAVTGQDAGPTTDAWVKLYPHAVAEAEGVRLAAALRAALPDQREQLLVRYRDAKEDHYTEGLAHAIPHVPVKFQEKVRAGAGRAMSRLPADELRAYLEDEGELRLAAARACVRKADRGNDPGADRPVDRRGWEGG